ncbi:MAG: hypothetical protein VB086_03425 [Clostridiaceae bacterium]|nr:hypothetical protein [Clostridiaceae bacterium]
MHMNLKPAFRYQFRDYLKGTGVFFLVMVVIFAASVIGARYSHGNVSFFGISMATAICLFILGIATPRSNLRLCVQFGVSRRTAFISLLLAVLADIVILSLAGELLLYVGQSVGASIGNLSFRDLYQMLYLGTHPMFLSISQHIMSVLLNSSLTLLLFVFGMFFTFLFWRLNKIWTIIVAVAIPLLINVIPAILYKLGSSFPAIGQFFRALQSVFTSSVWNLMALFLLLSVILAGIDWLLIRLANIKEPASK